MATANKCDRCGVYYDWNESVNYTSKRTLNGKPISAPANRLALFCQSTRIETLDLCPDCMQQVTTWIENGSDPKKKDFVL